MKEGWEERKLGDVCVKSANIKWEAHKGESFQYIDLSAVSRESLKITESSLVNSTNAPSRAKKIICSGDVLFATTRPTLRRAAIVADEYDNQICSTGFTVLRPNTSVITTKYIHYILQSESFMDEMKELQRGASYPAVTDGDVKGFSISVPSLEEQKQIVAVLDKAFAAIDLAKANIEKNLQNAKELFQSKLNEIFTQKGEGWEDKKLSEISIEFGRGKSKHRPRNDQSLYGGSYPFVQTGDVRNAHKKLTKYTQTYNEKGLAQSKLWSKGTICITIAANIAEIAILDFDACFPDSVIGLVVDPEKSGNDYAFYCLLFLQAELKMKGKGSAQDNINMGTFESQYFPIPSLKEQKQIVLQLDDLLEKTRQVEATCKQKIEGLNELKKSTLQKAFSGEMKYGRA